MAIRLSDGFDFGRAAMEKSMASAAITNATMPLPQISTAHATITSMNDAHVSTGTRNLRRNVALLRSLFGCVFVV